MAVTIEVIDRCKREILEDLDKLIRITEESPGEHYLISTDLFVDQVRRKLYLLENQLFTAKYQELKET